MGKKWLWTLSLLVLVLGGVAEGAALAQPLNAFERPVSETQHQLGSVMGCEWRSSGATSVCQNTAIAGQLSLSRSSGDGGLETVEMNALLVAQPRHLSHEKQSENTVLAVVKSVLPEWKAAAQWTKKALQKAREPQGRSVTKVGRITVLVQWLLPADVEGEYATVVITKKPSIEEWSIDN